MRIILPFLLLCLVVNAKASTSITTSAVSGHWTLSGSPYLINNDIQVASAQSLTIDAGVSVQGATKAADLSTGSLDVGYGSYALTT